MERWIFLRGLARRKEHWGEFLERFKATRPEAAIEALDLAGNGSERERPSFQSIPEYVEDLRTRSELLKIGSVRVVAISLGGMVASEWARRYPTEFQSLHLINTSDRTHSAFWERLQPQNYLTLLGILAKRPQALDREQAVLSMVSNLEPHARSRWAERFSKLETCSPQNFFNQLYAALRFRPEARGPMVQTTVLCSEGDRFVSAECSKRIAKNWGAELRVHPSAGHDLPLDDPEWVLEAILGAPNETILKAEPIPEG